MNEKDIPKKIIVQDLDMGYIIAELKEMRQQPDKDRIYVYEYKDYFHNIDSAIKEHFQ